MTLGTFVLMVLWEHTQPPRLFVESLAATGGGAPGADAAVLRCDVAFQPMKWRNVIVHSSLREDGPLAKGCHFVVRSRPGLDGRYVAATERWRNQLDGRHAYVRGYDLDRESIGICLVGDFSTRGPRREQFEALVELVRLLRRECIIPADRVYLANELPLPDKSPGPGFPAELFDRLIRISR